MTLRFHMKELFKMPKRKILTMRERNRLEQLIYKIYEEFPEEATRNAVEHLNEKQIITFQKRIARIEKLLLTIGGVVERKCPFKHVCSDDKCDTCDIAKGCSAWCHFEDLFCDIRHIFAKTGILLDTAIKRKSYKK